MRTATSPSIRIGARIALAAAALSGVVSAAFAQSTEMLSIGFAPVVSQQVAATAVPLSPALTAAIALLLAVSAFVIFRRRTGRGRRLFGWLLLSAGATLAVGGGERAISEAQAALPSPAINLTTSPGTLDLLAYWNSNIEPLAVTVTNTSGQSVRLTSVATDNTNLYILSTPTTCVVNTTLAPSAQCTVTLSIQ